MVDANNGIIGDIETELPSTTLPEEDLRDEIAMARFSQSAEFKRLEDYINGHIEHWQHFLPGNVAPITVSKAERGHYWAVADEVIKFGQGILSSYTQANEAVKAADVRRRNS